MVRVSLALLEAYTEHLQKRGVPEIKHTKVNPSDLGVKVVGDITEVVSEGLGLLVSLMSEEVKEKIFSSPIKVIEDTDDRAVAHLVESEIRCSDLLGFLHEMGHFIEHRLNRRSFCSAWRDARSSGEEYHLSELDPTFDDDEVAMLGDYVDPYIGKVYVDGGTEVLSVGLEIIGDDRDRSLFMEYDFEHFALVLGVLEGKL